MSAWQAVVNLHVKTEGVDATHRFPSSLDPVSPTLSTIEIEESAGHQAGITAT